MVPMSVVPFAFQNALNIDDQWVIIADVASATMTMAPTMKMGTAGTVMVVGAGVVVVRTMIVIRLAVATGHLPVLMMAVLSLSSRP